MQSRCCKASRVLRDLHHWAPKFGLVCQVDWFFLRTRTPKKCFGSKKWCWCEQLRSHEYLFHFCFIQDQRSNQFLEWKLSMHIIGYPKMKKLADKVSFSSFHTRMIQCVWSMRWSYLSTIFRFCFGGWCQKVVSDGEPNQGNQVDLSR